MIILYVLIGLVALALFINGIFVFEECYQEYKRKYTFCFLKVDK